MALCPCPSRARGGVAAEDARCSERLTGSRRARDHDRVMWVSREGFRSAYRLENSTVAPPPSARQDENRAPERQPSRPSDFGMLIELSIKFPEHYPSRAPNSQSSSRVKQRVPRALAGPSSEFPLRRIVNFVRPWSKQAILRSITTKTHDYLRYREAHARTIDKNVRSPLPRPRKTVSFDRQRPKPTVFRIAHPPERGRGAGAGARFQGEARRQGKGRGPRSEGRGLKGEGAAPSSKGLCKRHGTKHGFLYMLEPLTVRKRLRAPAASRYSVRKRKRRLCAKERSWRRLG